MKYLLKKIIKQEDKGVAAIEFALILPVFALMFIGLIDVSNLVYCHNKMNRTAQDISNIVTRGDLTKSQLDALLKATINTAYPFDFKGFGNVIVTAVSHPDPDPTKPSQVMWRDSYPGGTGGSRISASSLRGLTLAPNETAVFTEVFFNFQPLYPGYVISNTSIYAVAAAVPRQGTMAALSQN